MRGCLPRYDYDADHSVTASRVVCVLREDPERVSWTRTKYAETTKGTWDAYQGVDKVRRKKFSPPPKPVIAGSLRLDQMGAFLYDTGDIVCTGRVSDESVPANKSRGANATVIVRAYAGIQGKDDEELNGAAMVWRQERRLWVRNGLPRTVSLLPTGAGTQIGLKRHFDEITHLELELRYDKGR